MSRIFLFILIAATIIFAGAEVYIYLEPNPEPPLTTIGGNQLSNVSAAVEATTSAAVSTSTVASTTASNEPSAKATLIRKASVQGIISTTTSSSTASSSTNVAERIPNPYSTPAESFDDINTVTREALVNILCEPQYGSSLNPISGSGVIIDPRGIILTNAHVAQYVLLSESPQVDLKCFIRTGSPATAQWTAVVLYIPPIWVKDHADEILDQHPTGTGEHDYAFLYITGSTTNTPPPTSFPYLPVDTRPAIGFPGDQVLVGSYPAELIGGIAAQYDLYADTSVTTIKQLLTFNSGTPDVVSLGGIIEAQEGSSGGAVVNAWGRLIALIATTSEGTTTADRDLRGISLSYIDSDLTAQSGMDLSTLLESDPLEESEQFTSTVAPSLIDLYVNILSKSAQQ